MKNIYGIDFDADINRERVFKVLKFNEGSEVNAWELSFQARVLHYTQAIMELRSRLKGEYEIINRIETKGKVRHSFYTLKKIKQGQSMLKNILQKSKNLIGL